MGLVVLEAYCCLDCGSLVRGGDPRSVGAGRRISEFEQERVNKPLGRQNLNLPRHRQPIHSPPGHCLTALHLPRKCPMRFP